MEEPKRRSFFDVVKLNMRLADRPEPVTRFAYVASYKGLKDDLLKLMKNNVKELNAEYGKIVLTGLLLVYPESFVHILEASQETIYRHLQEVLNSSGSVTLINAVSLPAHHFVYKMYFSEWYVADVANPPVLLDKIENFKLEEICKQMKNFLFKVYSLGEYLMNRDQMKDILQNLSKVAPHLLPEVTVIEYLLAIKSPAIPNLRMHLTKFYKVPFLFLYNEYLQYIKTTVLSYVRR